MHTLTVADSCYLSEKETWHSCKVEGKLVWHSPKLDIVKLKKLLYLE